MPLAKFQSIAESAISGLPLVKGRGIVWESPPAPPLVAIYQDPPHIDRAKRKKTVEAAGRNGANVPHEDLD